VERQFVQRVASLHFVKQASSWQKKKRNLIFEIYRFISCDQVTQQYRLKYILARKQQTGFPFIFGTF
jgi:hypothetical protein